MSNNRKTTKKDDTTYPKPKKIRVMISSRCNDQFNGISLSQIRTEIKTQIEKQKLFGLDAYEVWTNETGLPSPQNSWDECLQRIKESDIVIILYNGNSGWARQGNIGICHEEFNTAMREARGKVRLIWLFNRDDPRAQIDKISKSENISINNAFLQDVLRQNLFSTQALTREEVLEQVNYLIADTTTQLVRYGVRYASKGKRDSGQALDWTKLSLFDRSEEMKKSVAERIQYAKGILKGEQVYSLPIDKKKYLLKIHAVPSSMGIAAAREMVGQPFLNDHLIWGKFSKYGSGPIHLIACHQGITESQAVKQLGTPDSTVVSGKFGVYVADEIQKIQMIFLANCWDRSSTMRAVDDFFDWAGEVNEISTICDRAEKRQRILQTINEVNG